MLSLLSSIILRMSEKEGLNLLQLIFKLHNQVTKSRIQSTSIKYTPQWKSEESNGGSRNQRAQPGIQIGFLQLQYGDILSTF